MLLTVGDLVEDVVVWPAGRVQRGTDTPAHVERRRGGSAANVAAFAAAASARVRFIGCVGDDAAGAALTASLAASGVDVRVQRRGRTGTIVVLVEPGGERTMLPDRAACTALLDVPDAWLDGAAWLHVPAYSLMGEPLASTVNSMIARLRAVGARLSVDASSVGSLVEHGVDAFVAWVRAARPDVLFANGEEAAALDVPRSLDGAAALTIVKRGPDPVLVHDAGDDAVTAVPVPPVPDVRDTTGAGDAFAAGFIASTLGGASPVAATEAGIALARRVLGNPGATL